MNDSGAKLTESESLIEGGIIKDINDSSIRIDPLKKEKATTTRRIAYALLGMLFVTFVMQFIGIVALHVTGHSEAVEAMTNLFTIWLPVISGLSGSAVTYFFTKEEK